MLGSKSKLTASNSGGGSGSGRQTPGALGGSGLNTIVCGDCAAPNPCSASINRGILLCSDCGSVHRSLGRHISQIKLGKFQIKGCLQKTDLFKKLITFSIFAVG